MGAPVPESRRPAADTAGKPERLYPLEEALRLTGLGPARFRFLEREFGAFMGIADPLFHRSLYTGAQIALFIRIDGLLQRDGFSVELVRERIAAFLSRRRDGLWVTAVTSGKGGVGKTSIATNLAVAMARQGVAPVLVDADLGLANAHLLLGVMPERTLDDLVRGTATMDQILVKTSYGVSLVPGGSGVKELADLDPRSRDALVREVRRLYYYAQSLVVDTGSGISAAVLRFLRLADDIVVVATPNIASCLDALGVIRAAEETGCPGRINVLVNRCRDDAHGREVFLKLHRALRQLTDRHVWYLGHVPEDPHMEESFQRGTPVASLSSSCRAARQLRHLAQAMLSDRDDRPAAGEERLVELLSGVPGARGAGREDSAHCREAS